MSSAINARQKQEAMLKALQAENGSVRRAAKAARISPQSHYNWYKSSAAYRDGVDTIRYQLYEEYKELVLEAVLEKIKEGNVAVINRSFQAFFAGWVEQMERANPYKPRLTAEIKYVDLPLGHDSL
jgi:hypothetical protein